MKREVGRALWVTQEFITLLTLKVEGERGNARQQYQTRAMGPRRVGILSETLAYPSVCHWEIRRCATQARALPVKSIDDVAFAGYC